MKALAVLCAVLAVLGTPADVQGQETAPTVAQEPLDAPDDPPGDDVIVGLALRAPAPFAGQLFDPDTAIRWLHRLEWYRNELRLERRTRISLLDAERRSHEVELTLTRESYEREITGLRTDMHEQAATAAAAIARAQEHPWYDTFAFGLTIGVVAVAVIIGVLAGLLNSI